MMSSMAASTSSPSKEHNESSGECKVEKFSSRENDLETEPTTSICDVEMDSNESGKLDENLSDSEDYDPEFDENSDNSSDTDAELSDLEDEKVIKVTSKLCGGVKFYKLKFDDVEEKRKQYLGKIQASEEGVETSSNDEKENVPSDESKPTSETTSKAQFSGYRSSLMALEEANYISDDDDDFNPMCCGDTLSDEEDSNGNLSDNEENTESEPEVEILDEKDRKTGETLKCIKMMKNYLIIPSEHDSDKVNSENNEKAMDQ